MNDFELAIYRLGELELLRVKAARELERQELEIAELKARLEAEQKEGD